LRATVTGVAMMLVNVFAIGLGTFVIGTANDLLKSFTSAPLTLTLVAADCVVGCSALLFAAVAFKIGRGHN
jgi:hypothetical protein